ncbi:MAG: rhodanese-like domain-containing protein [Microthrixaceae bacterium]
MDPSRPHRRSLKSATMVAAALVLIVLSAPGCGGEEAVAVPEAVAGQVTTIDSAQGKALIEAGGALVIDVRTLEEYREGHLVGAQSIPVEDPELWLTRTGPLDRDRPTVVYCRSGRRSLAAAQQLVEAGFTKVYDLGGVQDWEAGDLELDR